MRTTAAGTSRTIAPWYVGGAVVLFVLGTLHPVLQLPAWGLMALLSSTMMFLGPALTGSAMVRSWRVAGVCSLVCAMAAWTLDIAGDGAAPNVGVGSLVVDVAFYQLTVVIVLAVVSGRTHRRAKLGEIDPLVLFTMLIALVGTLLAMVSSHDPDTTGPNLSILVTYLTLDALVLALLGAQLWRDRKELGRATWLTLIAVETMLVGAIGELASNQLDLPNWVMTLRMTWLIGLILVGLAALMPSTGTDLPGLGVVVRRLSPAFWTMLVILFVGPPLELIKPSLANLVTMLVIAMVCLLLTEMRQRVRSEQAIRSAAAALAGATDPALMLESTLHAAEICAGPGRRILVCARGPRGLQVAATNPVDARLTADTAELTPAQFVDEALDGQTHVTVVSPRSTAQVALAIVDVRRSLGNWIGSLELLAAQAGLALNRIMLTAELSRRASEAYFQTLAANTADMILTVDEAGRIRYASPSTRTAFGQDVVGEPFEAVVGPRHAGALRDRLAETTAQQPLRWRLTAEGADSAVGTRAVGTRAPGTPAAAGREMETEVRVADLRTDPTVRGVVVTLRDVTAEAQLNQRLRDLAYHDQLTGLGNLAWFTDRFEQAVASGVRSPVVLMADIDGFTELNHLHGRATADLVLIAVARRLAGVDGVAARLDGGRFVVLTRTSDSIGPDSPDCGPDMAAAARQLQSRLSETVDFGSEHIAVTVVVGAARVDEIADVNEALRRTSLAVAEAKSDPSPPWRCYRPAMLEAAIDRDNLTRDLATAIDSGHLELWYQPVIDLRTGRVDGFEALARWQHPRRGMIPPNVFIPLAEETGLIVPLGRWVLRQAVRDTVWLRGRAGGRAVCVSVNAAPQQLAEPGFDDQVAAELAAAGLPPRALCLEITERSVVRSGSRTMDMLHSLKSLGVPLAIDDFGTGHSALSYLLEMPFDTVKIDMSFVAEITTSQRRAQLVQGITRIADAAGLSVVAEGIETKGQQEILAAAGCARGQGFHYSPPVPLTEAASFLRRGWRPRVA